MPAGLVALGTLVTFCCDAFLAFAPQEAYEPLLGPVAAKVVTRLMARILVVEDDADVRLVIEHVLLAAGHAVDAHETLDDARDSLRDRNYDLLLTDGRLRDGTGIELADRAAERGIPALIITGYAFILRELAEDPGRYRVLLKPMKPMELLYAVEQAIEEHAERQSGGRW